MTVRVDDVVGITGFIKPGTLVDIVVVTQPPKGTGQQEMISKIVLQNIKVIASGQNIYKPKNDRVVERAVRAVTLQVTPEEAEKLRSEERRVGKERRAGGAVEKVSRKKRAEEASGLRQEQE